jgi:peptidylprolyl isomerase
MDNPIIHMQLPQGRVLIECLPEKAPMHVAQILKICNDRSYDGIPFHRVIEGFMAQGGATGKIYPQLTAEFNDVEHLPGVCSMARTNDPNSASDQFFICFADCRFLDRQYTVWGRVISGMNHVMAITRGEPPATPTTVISMRVLLP